MATELSGWVMRQTWTDLLFAHWPVSVSTMRALVPEPLELDTFDGSAWIAVVPFGMSGIRGRGLPLLPGLSRTLELNVRTYVRYKGRGGVYFFSLDAASRVIVRGARITYRLPYYDARMSWDGSRYESVRMHKNAAKAEFRAEYKPTGPVFNAVPNSLEHFLTERYSLFTAYSGKVYRGDIQHEPWPLQPAAALVETNTMTGMELSGTPLLHFARTIDVRIGRIHRV